MNAITIIRTHDLTNDGQRELLLVQKGNLFAVVTRDWRQNQVTDGGRFASPAGSMAALETVANLGPRAWADEKFAGHAGEEMSDAEVAERDAMEAKWNAALPSL